MDKFAWDSLLGSVILYSSGFQTGLREVVSGVPRNITENLGF